MIKSLIILSLTCIAVFVSDQALKQLFLDGFRWQSEYIDLVLTFNKGVAFSMFAFLGEYLKYIQAVLVLAVLVYVLTHKDLLNMHSFAFGIIIGAGASNVYDRFIHGGVVDYVFWHKWFNFAVFNFADVMIDFAVVLILLQSWLNHKRKKAKST